MLGLNILDGTTFINDLRLLGNDKAELIVTSWKGYRNGGKTYHPHSWITVDNQELVKWINNKSQEPIRKTSWKASNEANWFRIQPYGA